MSLQNTKLVVMDLLFRRVFILFVVAGILSFVLIDRSALKVKTLNHLLPLPAELRQVLSTPDQVSREQLSRFLVYYKSAYEFVKNDPEAPAPCAFVGYAYYYLGEKDKAIQYLKRSVKLNSKFFWTQYNLAAIEFNDGNYQQAAEYFAAAISVSFEKSMYFMSLTKAYADIPRNLAISLKDYETSLRDGYERAKKLYVVSRALAENANLQRNIEKPRVSLQMF